MSLFVPKQSDFLSQPPKTKEALSHFLMSRVSLPCTPIGLEQFFLRNPMYFDVISFLWGQAKEPFCEVEPLHDVGQIILTQLDALRILVHSFFCSFEHPSSVL